MRVTRVRLRAAAGAAVLLAATAVSVAASSPAQAVEVRCNRVRDFTTASGQHNVWMPYLLGTFGDAYDCVLYRGLKDTDGAMPPRQTPVWQLQSTLNHCYAAGLSVDGDFGPRTEAALRWVQSAEGAVADGRYGPETRRKIKHQSTGEGCWKINQ